VVTSSGDIHLLKNTLRRAAADAATHVPAINRRELICCFVSCLAVLPVSSSAQSLPNRLPSWPPWREIPSIVVVSAESDSRLPAVREAVDFWNTQFSRLGSPFRLGAITHLVGMIPASDLRAIGNAIKGGGRIAVPDSIDRVSGDVIVALSDDAGFAPITFGGRALPKVLVAIPSDRTSPPTLSHHVRHDVAHELGHVIGLGHNDDETALMCGGVWCHFAVPRGGFLPLTKEEETKLLEMYPPNWQAEPSKR
jgi:hypothetical protein